MSTEIKTKEVKPKFKPQLLYIDEKLRSHLMDKYATDLGFHNNFITEAETLLKRDLTKSEIEKAIKNPKEFTEHVKTLIRSKFQFKNADESFNLQAGGLSFTGIDVATGMLTEQNKITQYVLEDGKLSPEPKHIKSLEEQSKIKTKNQRQNELFNVAKSIQDSAKALRSLGITYAMTEHHFGKATNQLVDNKSTGLVINYFKILQVR